MAKPIKETPFLRGKDAVRFQKTIEENSKKRVDPATLERINASYERISKIAQF